MLRSPRDSPAFGKSWIHLSFALIDTNIQANACIQGPVSMTSGAARLLAQQLAHVDAAHPFHEVYQRLISRDDNWISSQWMTERPGGK